MNILIYGGTFDPPHTGHISMLRRGVEFVKDFGPLCVHVVPAWQSPTKVQPEASYGHRLKMCRMMIDLANQPGYTMHDVDLVLDAYEGTVGDRVFSVDYVKHIHEASPSSCIWFLAGSDILEYVYNWKNVNELLRLCTLLVAIRPGYRIPYEMPGVEECIGCTRFLPRPTWDVSSTGVRQALFTGRDAVEDEGLPAEIFEYIKKEGLYRTDLTEKKT